MTPEENIKLGIISAYMGRDLTEEQKEFASDFTKDTISFSDPGTGKTQTLIAGLVLAQTYHKVPGKEINCMSFTNAAVAEIAGRYEALCKKCQVSPTIKFNTFHSLSNHIMRDAYPRMSIRESTNKKEDVVSIAEYLKELGVEVKADDVRYLRRVLRAIDNLNSSLTFHPDNLQTKYSFVELGLNLNVFQELRKRWFLRGIINNEIVQGDIPLYCLYALMKDPRIAEKWRGKYKIMVVDEFQDLSLLHLRILSYVAKTLIVIGDMKQQIYAFNGACPQIVREYMKLHPDAKVSNLTKSFRCGQEIAEFATKLILPNDRSIKCFEGAHTGSSVKVMKRSDMNWAEIAQSIEVDQKTHGSSAKNVMFLYRNNASAIPIIEELYKRKIPFRCPKFATVMDIPIFSTITKLCEAALYNNDPEKCNAALRCFPEFRDTHIGNDTFPVMAMKSSGKSLFEVNYKYKETSSTSLLQSMKVAAELIKKDEPAGHVYNALWKAYMAYIYKTEAWSFDNTPEFYTSLLGDIMQKSYGIMIAEEYEKQQKNVHAISAGVGIRCYTMHSAKGLEADDVYILDCNEGLFPNAKVMKSKIDAHCLMDVAVDIRSERNLLYVAVTRAKQNVVITYSSGSPAILLSNPEDPEYTKYDAIYNEYITDYNDAEEFFKLFKLEDSV